MVKRGGSVRIKRLHDDLGVNTAKVRVTAAKHNLVMFMILVKNMLSINDAGYNCWKITTAKRVSTVRRIKTRERIHIKIVYQDYLRDNALSTAKSKVSTARITAAGEKLMLLVQVNAVRHNLMLVQVNVEEINAD
ncbi:hypothetical protein Tco_1489044 [Tanacetum coccineum]